MMVQASLGLIVLATLILAFLASKKWHWAHVLVVVGIVFASIGYLMLLVPSMQKRLKHQKAFAEADARLEQTLPLVAAMQRGTDDPGLIRQLGASGLELNDSFEAIEGVHSLQEKVRLGKRLRGRKWLNAEPGNIDQQAGEVTLSIAAPSPLGIEEGALLFAFEQGEPSPNSPQDGNQYLGEFRVVATGEQEVTLAPVQELDGREADRLINSAGPWVLHETMPVDDPTLFAGMSEEQLRALFPEAVIDEYLREGTPWTSDDGDETKQGFNDDDQEVGPDDWDQAVRFTYRRLLRDYSASFQELNRHWVELKADVQALTEDNAKIEAALQGAQQLQAYREEKGRKLRHDLDGRRGDQQAIEEHLAALERQAEKAEMLLAQTLAANSRLVEELTAAQQAASGRDLLADPTPSRGATDVDAL